MAKKHNWDNIILETYNLLYDASYPKVNFNDLKDNCLVYEDRDFKHIIVEKPLTTEECLDLGYKRVIDFYAYYCPKEIQEKIIKNQIKKYKIKHREASMFSTTIYLGISPTSNKESWLLQQSTLTIDDLNNWLKETYPNIVDKN